MGSSFLFILLYLLIKSCWSQKFNILVINDKNNEIGNKTLKVVLDYFKHKANLGVQLNSVVEVQNTGDDGQEFLDSICAVYQDLLTEGKPPDLVIDLTLTGVVSEAAKTFSMALALPTVTTTYGQELDIRTWRNLDPEEQKYLVQISPPGDLIAEIVRSLAIYQNISNAGVLFDSSFEMDHKYKALLRNLPTRHIIIRVDEPRAIKDQLIRLRNLEIVNFFILGNLTTIKNVLDMANINKYFNRKFAWHVITQEEGQLKCSCTNCTVLFVRPNLDENSSSKLNSIRTIYSLTEQPELVAAFHFDVIVRSILALKSMYESSDWPSNTTYMTCDDYSEENKQKRINFDFRKYFKQVNENDLIGKLKVDTNGNSFMEFSMKLEKVSVLNSKITQSRMVGTWDAGLNQPIKISNKTAIANFSAVQIFRVVTVLQKPFMMMDIDSNGEPKFSGYCYELLKKISEHLNFEFEISVAPDKEFGKMNEKGEWNGIIRELMDKRAEIGMASMYVTAERENVIDFTVPYYDLVGITILMKKPKPETSLFKFLTVLEGEVWLCILGSYFFTSFLLWGLDRFSPYSYHNNREVYKDDDEQREFSLKECLWFCMTSLTPQGGGEAPKNMSGKLVAATWWLFGFIIIASYTANLAAFLTVSRLDTPIESLDDLVTQYKIQYAPANNSWVQTYFKRMADIEKRFYYVWKNMTLNTSLSNQERAELAVWDYPISDKYTKMWNAMNDAGFPADLDEAVARVLSSKTSSEGFAYIGDAIDIKYLALTNCELQMVGDEFSRKPFAVAVQQGSPLKDSLNNAILLLLNKRSLEKLKDDWWNANPERKICQRYNDQSEGISIHNIETRGKPLHATRANPHTARPAASPTTPTARSVASPPPPTARPTASPTTARPKRGVFIVIFVGIILACITLAFEYFWMRYKKPEEDVSVSANSKIFEHRRKLAEQLKQTKQSMSSLKDVNLQKENVPYR